MINIRTYIVLYAAASALALGCKKAYVPPVISSNNSYLVVEGLINTGADSTFIKLTRTVKLSDANTPKPELGAIVMVEGDNNSAYPLQEAGNGVYSTASLNLPSSAKYRL